MVALRNQLARRLAISLGMMFFGGMVLGVVTGKVLVWILQVREDGAA